MANVQSVSGRATMEAKPHPILEQGLGEGWGEKQGGGKCVTGAVFRIGSFIDDLYGAS